MGAEDEAMEIDDWKTVMQKFGKGMWRRAIGSTRKTRKGQRGRENARQDRQEEASKCVLR